MNITYDMICTITEKLAKEAFNTEIKNSTGSDYHIGYYEGLHEGIQRFLREIDKIDNIAADDFDKSYDKYLNTFL